MNVLYLGPHLKQIIDFANQVNDLNSVNVLHLGPHLKHQRQIITRLLIISVNVLYLGPHLKRSGRRD